MNILGQLESDPRFARVIDIIHHDQEQTMTTPDQTTVPQPPRQPSTVSQFIHSSLLHARQMGDEIEGRLAEIGRAFGHALPMIERIVSDPILDEFVEAALRASDAGVEAAIFQAFTDTLRAATASKTGPQQVLPAPPATPPADPAVTAQQPAAPDAPEQDAALDAHQQ